MFTLEDGGTLRFWPDGAAQGAVLAVPAPVRAFCGFRGEPWIGTIDRQSQFVLWHGSSGNWSRFWSFKQDKDEQFRALDCSGDEPLVLTSKSMRLAISAKTIPVEQGKQHSFGFATTLQHGGYLYVGMNAGEWGGGLMRFALAGGRGEAVDASDPKNLCGGTLNAACDPVTGMAPDPLRPECLLASSGLAHILSGGALLRICDGRIELAYTKPYTLDPEWKFNPAEETGKALSSVPFYSLAAGSKGVWAVGSDGIYRFGSDPVPSFTAFDPWQPQTGSRIDWSNPDFVLIRTSMNQRHSLSGESLLLVPRER